MQRRYITVDVFTDRAFGGNPLAVVLDASGLSTAQGLDLAMKGRMPNPPKGTQIVQTLELVANKGFAFGFYGKPPAEPDQPPIPPAILTGWSATSSARLAVTWRIRSAGRRPNWSASAKWVARACPRRNSCTEIRNS